jgi:hypothetical protein
MINYNISQKIITHGKPQRLRNDLEPQPRRPGRAALSPRLPAAATDPPVHPLPMRYSTTFRAAGVGRPPRQGLLPPLNGRPRLQQPFPTPTSLRLTLRRARQREHQHELLTSPPHLTLPARGSQENRLLLQENRLPQNVL